MSATVTDRPSRRGSNAPDVAAYHDFLVTGKERAQGQRGKLDAFDAKKILSSAARVEVDVGAGRGIFALARAASESALRLLAIERKMVRCRHLARRARNEKLFADVTGNAGIVVIRGDATTLVPLFPSASVDIFHIYFPEPWHRPKWISRRLVSPAFAAAMARALIPGGEVRFVTDHAELFRAAVAVLASTARLRPADTAPWFAEETFETNFARKWRAEERPFHAARFVSARRQWDGTVLY